MSRPRRFRPGFGLGLVIATGAFGAVAAPKKPVVEVLPPPSISLRVDPRQDDQWVMEISNDGEVPLRVIADARLLRLEITPPPVVVSAVITAPPLKAKLVVKTAKTNKADDGHRICELPTSMRSSERVLELPPHTRYLEAFDPRLFCLGASSSLLVPGSTVVAKLGWAAPKSGVLAPPFAVAPPPPPIASASIDKPTVASAKELAGASFTLKAKSPKPGPASPPKSPALVAKTGAARSVLAEKDADVTLVVRNESGDDVIIYARPQLVAALVRSPRGDRTLCEGWKPPPAPIVDFVTKLKPGGEWSTTIGIVGLCPPGTFDRPGLYEVQPVLHAQLIPKIPKAFVGDIYAKEPQLIRIEEGKKPFHDFQPFALTTSE